MAVLAGSSLEAGNPLDSRANNDSRPAQSRPLSTSWAGALRLYFNGTVPGTPASIPPVQAVSVTLSARVWERRSYRLSSAFSRATNPSSPHIGAGSRRGDTRNPWHGQLVLSSGRPVNKQVVCPRNCPSRPASRVVDRHKQCQPVTPAGANDQSGRRPHFGHGAGWQARQKVLPQAGQGPFAAGLTKCRASSHTSRGRSQV